MTHRLADVDAYCAVYAIARFFPKIAKNSNVKVVFPGGLNAVARKVSTRFPLRAETDPDFSNAELIAIVDTNNPLLLAESMKGVLESKAKKMVIDHHPLNNSGKKMVDINFIDTKSSSACEIVYELYRSSNVQLSKRIAQILLLGIMADSQHLFLASGRTITVVSELYKLGASLELARTILTRRREISERMARLKGAGRISLYNVDDFILAISRIGSFHASVAKALVDLGADLAIAVGGEAKESKASLRATQQFYEETGLHLGTDIAGKIADSGGGHPTAASLSSTTIDIDSLEALLVGALEAKLGKLVPVKK